MFEHFEVVISPFDRKRIVRVILPNGYDQSETNRYPVLYMHDGQNLFKDEDASYGMSWGISDYLNKSGLELIVVGVDCNTEGYKRLDEYGPWKYNSKEKIFPDQPDELGGEGKEYIDFIVHELKPLIDKRCRTKPDETSMAGSSMGGLITTYAACTYPNIFKRVASVSSAYWFNQKEIEDLITDSDLSAIEKFYLDVGTKESTEDIDNMSYVRSSQLIYHLIKSKVRDCKFEIVEGAIHNELAWKDRIPIIFSYLYG